MRRRRRTSTDFDMRYAQKLYGPMVTGASAQDMAMAMAMYPQMKPALDKMRAEGDQDRRHRDPDRDEDGSGAARHRQHDRRAPRRPRRSLNRRRAVLAACWAA